MFTILSFKNFLVPSPPNLVKEYFQESNELRTSLLSIQIKAVYYFLF